MARIDQLKALANQFPVANQQVANQLEAARTIQLQKQIGAAPAAGISQTAPAASQLGAQQAAAKGGAALEQGAAQANQAVQTGQLALAQQGAENREAVSQQSLAQNRTSQDLTNNLAKLDLNLKNKIIDEQLTFKKDQAGKAIFNEQQLADYAVTNARSDIELNKYRQMMEQAWQKKLYMLQTAQKKLENVLNQGYIQEGQELDQAQKSELIQAKQALEMKIKKDQARAQNQMAKMQAAGTILGAGVGAVVAGPMGPAAGASIGASVGSGLGSFAGSQGVK